MIEVHQDVYGSGGDPRLAAQHRVRGLGLEDQIDARALADTIDERAGVARQVYP